MIFNNKKNGKPLRAFYFLNHQTAMPFEVKLLVELGFEVFVTKQLSRDAVVFRSGLVSYEYDETLTLPSDIIEKLNNHNFYDDPIPKSLKDIIESEFDLVFLIQLPRALDDFASFYTGVIFSRIYGESNEFSYSDYYKRMIGPRFPVLIERMGDRFFFAAIFPEIAENEKYFKDRLLWTPLGVPDSFWRNQNTWCGGGEYLLAYFPDFKTVKYYEKKYEEFISLFSTQPYKVMGRQSETPSDSNVLGYLDDQEIHSVYQNCSAYTYTSDEKRHLHYTPIEAMIIGAPVLFNKHSILSSMFQGDAPGAYGSAEAARKLASRLVANDSSLIQEIKKSQEQVLKRQEFDWCCKQWKTAFEDKVFPVIEKRRQKQQAIKEIRDLELTKNKIGRKLSIAVILPEIYRGGTLRGAINIARMLAIGAHNDNSELELSFGYVDSPTTYNDSDFSDLLNIGVKVRPFRREAVESKKLQPILDRLSHKPSNFNTPTYWNFNDGISNFEDCDFWIIVSDRIQLPIPPHRPYAVVVYDYIQRYVPDIFGVTPESDGNWKMFDEYARATREAQFVICTTDQTKLDCINYAGVNAKKVFKFPMEFDPLESESSESTVFNHAEFPPYLIWTTNSTQHKNHIKVIEGLQIYFQAHPNSKLEIHVTGVYTHLFSEAGVSDPHFSSSYAMQVRRAISASPEVQKRIRILGNLTDEAYLLKLRNSYALLHGALYDNGTYSIVEAAWWGIPSVSSNYPAIIEACEIFGLNPVLFDPYSPSDLARSINELIENYEDIGKKIPSIERLKSRTFNVVANKYWDSFVTALECTGNEYNA